MVRIHDFCVMSKNMIDILLGKKVDKLLGLYAGGVIGSLFGGLLFYYIYKSMSALHFDIKFGGDKGIVLFPLFFGVPLGTVIGYMFIDKVFQKNHKLKIVAGLIGWFASVLGVFISLFLISSKGLTGLVLTPFIVAAVGLVGYSITRYRKPETIENRT